MSARAVYVTGMGVVSCLGSDVDRFWTALCNGECGLSELTRFDLEGVPYRLAGQVRDFPLEPFAECGLSAGAQFALGAASSAVDGLPADRRGGLAVVLATNFGPVERIERQLAGEADEGPLPNYRPWIGYYAEDARRVARKLGAGGPIVNVSLSCASGNSAVAYALNLIRHGRAEAALVCGYDSIQRTSWAGLCALRVMSLPQDDLPAAVRPFDRSRNGTIFSEGAGCLLLESAESARERGARVLAEVAGAAANNNAYHMTHADEEGEGTAAAMRMALRDAGLGPDDVDHVNAHGTGTRLNDAIETRSLRAVLGPRAGAVPVTSLKGGLGHAMGAASALEAVSCVLTLGQGRIPPTVNHMDPDPDCDLDIVHGAPRAADCRVVLNNSAGIGGANAALVLRRPENGSDVAGEAGG